MSPSNWVVECHVSIWLITNVSPLVDICQDVDIPNWIVVKGQPLVLDNPPLREDCGCRMKPAAPMFISRSRANFKNPDYDKSCNPKLVVFEFKVRLTRSCASSSVFRSEASKWRRTFISLKVRYVQTKINMNLEQSSVSWLGDSVIMWKSTPLHIPCSLSQKVAVEPA